MALSAWIKKAVNWGKKYPWLIAFLLSVAGGIWQWHQTREQERRKNEAALIAKAIEPTDKRIVSQNLKLLLDLGLVTVGEYPERLVEYANKPEKIPGFAGAAVRDNIVTIEQVKIGLNKLQYYHSDDMTSNINAAYRQALARFQLDKCLDPDGLLGPKTLRALMEAAPEHFGLKVLREESGAAAIAPPRGCATRP